MDTDSNTIAFKFFTSFLSFLTMRRNQIFNNKLNKIDIRKINYNIGIVRKLLFCYL